MPVDSIYLSQKMGYGFPGGPVVKNPSADSGEMGLILVPEDSTGCGSTKPRLLNKRSHRDEKPAHCS